MAWSWCLSLLNGTFPPSFLPLVLQKVRQPIHHVSVRGARALRRFPVKIHWPSEGVTESLVEPKPPRRGAVEGGVKGAFGGGVGGGAKQRSRPSLSTRLAKGNGRAVGTGPAGMEVEDRAGMAGQGKEPLFNFASSSEKRLGRLVMLTRSSTKRDKSGCVVLEGRRLVADALQAGATLESLFYTEPSALDGLPLAHLPPAVFNRMRSEQLQRWSDVVASQGIIGIVKLPKRLSVERLRRRCQDNRMGLSLVCDNIRDPGNLGSIIRTAAAAGCQQVLLTKGCVDAWETKVLRAGAGAHFRISLRQSLTWPEVAAALSLLSPVHVADTAVVGAQGLRGSDRVLTVSENHNLSEGHTHDYADGSEPNTLFQNRKMYHQPWACRSGALIIGGETHGLSPEALQLMEKTEGCRLYVPMDADVESLNAAVATGILLFEAQRQLLKQSAGNS
uniref:rRNA methyltransferase 3, mitochondrial isoform X1 n=1 Tax=Myxine glutinosa TaxID=7769 RepID=UPI00358EDA57